MNSSSVRSQTLLQLKEAATSRDSACKMIKEKRVIRSILTFSPLISIPWLSHQSHKLYSPLLNPSDFHLFMLESIGFFYFFFSEWSNTALCSSWLSAHDCKQVPKHRPLSWTLLSQIILSPTVSPLLAILVVAPVSPKSLCPPLGPVVLCSSLWAVFGQPLLAQQSKGLTAQNNLVHSTAHHSSRLQELHTYLIIHNTITQCSQNHQIFFLKAKANSDTINSRYSFELKLYWVLFIVMCHLTPETREPGFIFCYVTKPKLSVPPLLIMNTYHT